MAHGFAKLSRGSDVFATALSGLGVPAPHVMAWLTIGVELLGGAAVLLGAGIVIASIPMTAVLLVAIATVHLQYGFSSIKLVAVTAAGPQFGKPGYETALLYIACLAALVAGGAGPLSIDDLMRARRDGRGRKTGLDHPLDRRSVRAVEAVDNPSVADVARLDGRLDAFNAETTGMFDGRLLTILLKHEDGEIYAGLHGHTWGGCCEIKIFWIDAAHRGNGLGRDLLRSGEREARRRGCRQILLTTHSFQAPGFYEKEGYDRMTTVEDQPVGHSHIVMVKRLTV
jgi:putative oxidoreductase